MSETKSTTSMVPAVNGTCSLWHWQSPLPYLFCGLALTLALIFVALILLACSLHQRTLSDEEDQDKSTSPSNNSSTMVEMSPRIIVIMAGNQKPSHIGVPVSSSDKCPDD
ncbi:hypothetical protein CQW23_05506 [Capsicum baccatum]|uniref:Uncharacterized protein n=1 Tax=Capsicum baccatum TaxID=33114 RepID=A0A2G2XHQ7_CAPBA|nr:hypothetical protein CQW23_05506 [Capsicum baccatum]